MTKDQEHHEVGPGRDEFYDTYEEEVTKFKTNGTDCIEANCAIYKSAITWDILK